MEKRKKKQAPKDDRTQRKEKNSKPFTTHNGRTSGGKMGHNNFVYERMETVKKVYPVYVLDIKVKLKTRRR